MPVSLPLVSVALKSCQFMICSQFHMWVGIEKLAITSQTLPSIPVLLLSGLSSTFRQAQGRSDLFPRVSALYHKTRIFTISLNIYCTAEHFIFTVLAENISTAEKITGSDCFCFFYKLYFCFFKLFASSGCRNLLTFF